MNFMNTMICYQCGNAESKILCDVCGKRGTHKNDHICISSKNYRKLLKFVKNLASKKTIPYCHTDEIIFDAKKLLISIGE